MKLKSFLIISLVAVAITICACGAANNQSNADVAALQKQVEELQQQVQNNQQTQNTQPVQNTQPAQNTQPVQNAQQPVAQQPVQGTPALGNTTANITLDQAKQIAVTNAGLDINSVTFVKQMQDYDDGYMKWDVDFVAGDTKYDYDVSAYDGTILKSEREIIAYGGAVAAPTGGVPANAGVPVTGGMQQGYGQVQGIDVEQAKNAAVTHAGFTIGNVTFTKTKYDFDDGIAKWEIDFVVGSNKYEYEINATNGAIFKSQIESIYYD